MVHTKSHEYSLAAFVGTRLEYVKYPPPKVRTDVVAMSVPVKIKVTMIKLFSIKLVHTLVVKKKLLSVVK